jgi:hypothetical protein
VAHSLEADLGDGPIDGGPAADVAAGSRTSDA